MTLYVGENSFSQLHVSDNLNVATMLESWTTSDNTVVKNLVIRNHNKINLYGEYQVIGMKTRKII